MVKGIVGNFLEFQKILPKGIVSENDERLLAVEHYFASGGILSVLPNSNSWPNLVFPTKMHIKKRLESLEQVRQQYQGRLGQWQETNFEARLYKLASNIKKLKEPLYWKHLLKYSTDSDYRADSEKVKLPAHLVSDPKWKPMVKMFVSDTEYRKQLAETVESSIVYRKDRRVAKYANVLQEFRVQESKKKIAELKKKLSTIEHDIKALNVLMKWASG